MLQNPEMIQMALNSPQMRQMAQNNPMMQQILNNPQLLQQMLNPQTLQMMSNLFQSLGNEIIIKSSTNSSFGLILKKADYFGIWIKIWQKYNN